MAHLAGDALKYLRPSDKTVDNGVFKLFALGSVTVCTIGSALCMATQFFGSPIECDFDGSVNADMAKLWCWVHGSFWIKPDYQSEFDCRIKTYSSSIASELEAPKTVFYQWVALFLALQAGLFYLPYRLWKGAESGLMKGFDSEQAKSAFTMGDESEGEKVVKDFVRNFNVVLHHNTRYFSSFVACEVLNLIILVINFYLTNIFLDGKFANYGFEVMEYYRKPYELRSGAYNPMCEAFPTKVSCIIRVVGEGGKANTKNGLCVLSQNIINEKVFLVLYFWYIFLFVVGFFYAVYRAATLTVPQVREHILLAKARGRGMGYPVRKVLGRCQVGDWFVLNQICKNVNPHFYCEFMHELSENIEKVNAVKRKRIFGAFDKNKKKAADDAAPSEGGAAANHDGIALISMDQQQDRDVGVVTSSAPEQVEAGTLPKKERL